MPPPTTLNDVANAISGIVTTGTTHQRKALIEALIAEIKITAPGQAVPVFRIPQPHTGETAPNNKTALIEEKPLIRAPEKEVRAMTKLVGRLGLEPRTYGLKVRSSTN